MSASPIVIVAWSLLALVAAQLAALGLFLLVRAFRSRRLADLGPWHADRVTDELRVADYHARPRLEAYVERELLLLRSVQDRLARDEAPALHRFRTGGRRAPAGHNRSFLLQPPAPPRFAALLLHGLSDSPYMMRALGEGLRERGALVLGLRLPGHGTAPGGLLSTRWQDWWAATEYGVDQLRRRLPEGPLWIAGFSTGATLALRYALLAVTRETHPPPDRLVLLAPAVELAWVARFALWHRTLSWLPYFTKFRWQEVKPEYDPCKYSSFPKRAGAELFRLTRQVRSLAGRLDRRQREAMPPILAFQSLADDTVVATGLTRLLRRIGRASDELVLFDLNRSEELESLLRADEESSFPPPDLADGGPPPFTTTLVTNRETGTGAVEALSWPAGSRSYGPTAASRREELDERWPRDVLSLSHLSLPLPADDPLYGAASEIGAAMPRGERGVLAQPLPDLLRLRFNPFFGYLTRRLRKLAPDAARPR